MGWSKIARMLVGVVGAAGLTRRCSQRLTRDSSLIAASLVACSNDPAVPVEEEVDSGDVEVDVENDARPDVDTGALDVVDATDTEADTALVELTFGTLSLEVVPTNDLHDRLMELNSRLGAMLPREGLRLEIGLRARSRVNVVGVPELGNVLRMDQLTFNEVISAAPMQELLWEAPELTGVASGLFLSALFADAVFPDGHLDVKSLPSPSFDVPRPLSAYDVTTPGLGLRGLPTWVDAPGDVLAVTYDFGEVP